MAANSKYNSVKTPMRVQAITLVYYGLRRYKPGEIFVIESGKFFNDRCMKRLMDKPDQEAEPANGSYQPKMKLAPGSEPAPDPSVIPEGESAFKEEEKSASKDAPKAETAKAPSLAPKKERASDQDLI